jgi:hypothetical protein
VLQSHDLFSVETTTRTTWRCNVHCHHQLAGDAIEESALVVHLITPAGNFYAYMSPFMMRFVLPHRVIQQPCSTTHLVSPTGRCRTVSPRGTNKSGSMKCGLQQQFYLVMETWRFYEFATAVDEAVIKDTRGYRPSTLRN